GGVWSVISENDPCRQKRGFRPHSPLVTAFTSFQLEFSWLESADVGFSGVDSSLAVSAGASAELGASDSSTGADCVVAAAFAEAPPSPPLNAATSKSTNFCAPEPSRSRSGLYWATSIPSSVF